jgi:hypothetical protein
MQAHYWEEYRQACGHSTPAAGTAKAFVLLTLLLAGAVAAFSFGGPLGLLIYIALTGGCA